MGIRLKYSIVMVIVNLPKQAEARTVPLAQASPAQPTPEKPSSDSLLEPSPTEEKNSPA